MNNPDYDRIQHEADALSKDEKLQLVLHLIEQVRFPLRYVKPTDLSKHYGTIKWPIDALEYQKQVRAEWDR